MDFLTIESGQTNFTEIVKTILDNSGNSWVIGSRPYILPDIADTLESRGFGCFTKNTLNKHAWDKLPRFAILTPSTPYSEMNTVLEVFNSYENRFGEYIKIMITTQDFRDLVILNNVLHIHSIKVERYLEWDNFWKSASIQQCVGRIRNVVHNSIKIYKHVISEVSIEN